MKKNVYVTKPSMPSYEEYIQEIKTIWDKCWLTNMGEKHNELEKKLREFLKVDNVSLCVNGHSALEIAIQALDLSGEVITTPFTFVSTTHAICRNGLTPIFCDIDEQDYTIDINKIEELITKNTSAIIPVHVYGNVCKMEAIEKIAKKYKLKVIYDAAHAFGEEYNGRGIASFGDITIFSFHATKVFNSIEGGAICYSDSRLKSKIEAIRDFGIYDEEHVIEIGTNAKMNEFQAAMGLCNLRHFDDVINQRKIIYDEYIKRLQNIRDIKLPRIREGVKSNYAYFPIIVKECGSTVSRDEVFEKLKENGIFSRKYFYPLTNELECFKHYEKGNTPVAKHVSSNVLTIPFYADLQLEDVSWICDVLLDIFERKYN